MRPPHTDQTTAQAVSLTATCGSAAPQHSIPVVGYTGIHVLQETAEGWAHLVQGDVEHLGEETDLGSSTAGRAAAAARKAKL